MGAVSGAFGIDKITFVTVSYRPDIERFSLLRESIKRFYNGDSKHVVIVPKSDVRHFRNLLKFDSDVEIYCQADFAAPYFYPKKWYAMVERIRPGTLWRYKQHAGVRGWILQQPVKLSLPSYVPDGAAVILDSDVVFLRPFDKHDFIPENPDERMLIRIPQNIHRPQMEVVWKLWKRPLGEPGYHYTTMPMIMYPDWVASLQKHMESIYDMEWQRVLYNTGAVHEDCVYGIFVEEILKPGNVRIESTPLSHMIWNESSFDEFINHSWVSENGWRISPRICAVIQSNLGIDISGYRKQIEKIWDETSPNAKYW